MGHKPFSLSRIPGHDAARPVERIDATRIGEPEFRARYVDQLRPVLLAGAVAHWPAFARWRSPAYLVDRIGADTEVKVVTRPIIEYPTAPPATEDERAAMPFGELMRRAQEPTDEHLVLHACPLQDWTPLARLERDVGAFPFLPRPPRSRHYPPHRAFIYRSSFTDWHFHGADEALMCQVVGSKEVLLLPPDRPSWDKIWPIMERHGRTFDDERWRELEGASFVRAVVEPGDALYIPIFWWHAVEAVDATWGITVATTFPTALAINADLRFPAARQTMRKALASRSAPLAVASAVWSLATRIVPSYFTATPR
jgi:hypothetical protein